MDAIAATGYGQSLAASQLALVPIPPEVLAANLADLLEMGEEALRIRIQGGTSLEALATQTGADRQELRRRLAELSREEQARRREEERLQRQDQELLQQEQQRRRANRHRTLGTIFDEFL